MSAIADRLSDVVANLPVELQEEVLDFAQYLLDTKVGGDLPSVRPRFYICPICFQASEQRLVCHDHLMIACYADSPEDCKPIMDSSGDLKTRAPRWFVKTVARMPR